MDKFIRLRVIASVDAKHDGFCSMNCIMLKRGDCFATFAGTSLVLDNALELYRRSEYCLQNEGL